MTQPLFGSQVAEFAVFFDGYWNSKLAILFQTGTPSFCSCRCFLRCLISSISISRAAAAGWPLNSSTSSMNIASSSVLRRTGINFLSRLLAGFSYAIGVSLCWSRSIPARGVFYRVGCGRLGGLSLINSQGSAAQDEKLVLASFRHRRTPKINCLAGYPESLSQLFNAARPLDRFLASHNQTPIKSQVSLYIKPKLKASPAAKCACILAP